MTVIAPVTGNRSRATAPIEAPALDSLTKAECEKLLARNVVGRLAFALHDHVSIVPVNYVFADGVIYGRTRPGGKLEQIIRNRRVAFEVDEQEKMFEWRSVVVHGSFYLIDAEANPEQRPDYEKALVALRLTLPATLTDSDPVPFRNQIFLIQASEITGRRSEPGGVRMPATAPVTRDSGASSKSDARVQSAVGSVLREAGGKAAGVNVDVLDGIVVLGGTVDSAEEKAEIESRILALGDVRVIVQQLETALPGREQHASAELARDALREIEEMPAVDAQGLRVVVEHGWLRAQGSARNESAKRDALRRLRAVRGVRGIVDEIDVAGIE